MGNFLRSKKFIALITVIIFLGVNGFFVRNALVSVQKTAQVGRELFNATKTQDLDKLKEEIKNTRVSLKETEASLKPLVWTKFIPFLGAYYSDVEHLIQAGFEGLEAAEIATSALEPYADILGLKSKTPFVFMTAQERVKRVVKTVDKISPSLSELGQKLVLIRAEVDQIDPGRYPKQIGGLKLQENITRARQLVDQVETVLVEAKPAIEVLPFVLGEPNARNYFVLFQNDKELRPTGGFITAYALMRLEQGEISMGRSEDIYTIDNIRTKRVAPPKPIARYLPKPDGKPADEWAMRDANLSPDFKESMAKFEEFYQTVPGRASFDGIIAIDTRVVTELLKILGPVEAGGIRFSAETDKRCNCPNVVYELENWTEKVVPKAIAEGREIPRKAILGDLMKALSDKALSAPKQQWQPLMQVGTDLASGKHLLLYFHDLRTQNAFEKINWAGRIKGAGQDWDYLHVSNANFAGAKANLYIKQRVEEKIEIAKNGEVIKTVVIKYQNPQRHDEWLNGLYRNWLRVYVPQGSELLESSGSEVTVEKSEDLGKTIFESFITVRPQGSSEVTFKYKLPFKVTNKEYKLLLQKQPGTADYEEVIYINGKKKEDFKLNSDRELRIKI